MVSSKRIPACRRGGPDVQDVGLTYGSFEGGIEQGGAEKYGGIRGKPTIDEPINVFYFMRWEKGWRGATAKYRVQQRDLCIRFGETPGTEDSVLPINFTDSDDCKIGI